MNLYEAEHHAQNLLMSERYYQDYEVRVRLVRNTGQSHHATYLDPALGLVKLDCIQGFVTTDQLQEMGFVSAEDLKVQPKRSAA